MLPSLALDNDQSTPQTAANETQEEESQTLLEPSLEMLDLPTPLPTSLEANSRLTRISSWGIAIGFGTGVTALSLSLIPVSLWNGSLGVQKAVIGAAGIVWMVLTGVVWGLLQRHHEELGTGFDARDDGHEGIVRRKVVEGWRRVGALGDGKEVGRLRVTYWYLLGSALLQDGEPLYSFFFQGHDL